jgi:calcineurin-like phosphoesterase family protein
MIFFTSDLHLGHEKSISFTNRPFSDVEQMNSALIDNINQTVGERDELWVLGDFAFKIDMQQVRELRKRIKCRHLHLVKGNHDKDYSKESVFESVQDYKQLKTDYGVFILFHYPILEWNRAHYGSVHLHGHIHSTGCYNEENLKKKFSDRFMYKHSSKIEELGLRIYDVGVDANDYRPISLEKIAQLMNLKRIRGNTDGE